MAGGRPSNINSIVLVREVPNPDDPTGTPLKVHVTAAERVIEALERGNYLETAAAMAGVHKDTVYEWLKVGAKAWSTGLPLSRMRAHDRRCAEFSDGVAQAQAMAEGNDVDRLHALANGEDASVAARVLMWRLERRFAKRWGQKGSLEVTGADGGALTIDLADTARSLITDQLDRIAESMDQLAGPAPAPPPAVTPGADDPQV